jgi:hypothetical protein
MHLLLILLGFAVAMAAIALFFTVRPGLRKVRGGLDFMLAYGLDGAEFRFTHRRSGKQIAFCLRIVGGVKQLYFLVDRLLLVPEERAALLKILEHRGLKLQARRDRVKSEFVNVGHSPELANELACQVASEIMHWSRLTRFEHEEFLLLSRSIFASRLNSILASRSKKWRGP